MRAAIRAGARCSRCSRGSSSGDDPRRDSRYPPRTRSRRRLLRFWSDMPVAAQRSRPPSTSPSSARRRSGGLARLASFDIVATAVGLQASGYRVLKLPTNIVDKTTFFAAARAMLPLVPAVPRDHWDALDDSLFEGLLEHPGDRLAILWSGAGEMRERDRDAFSAAVQVLE